MQKIKTTIFFILLSFILVSTVLILINNSNKIIGGDRDEHGCLVPVGYTWNNTDKMCVREWEKESCAPETRNAEACVEIYDPVCGLPNKETYSNSCFACLDSNVQYHVLGQCQ